MKRQKPKINVKCNTISDKALDNLANLFAKYYEEDKFKEVENNHKKNINSEDLDNESELLKNTPLEIGDSSNLPKLLKPKDVQSYLGIGKDKLYILLKRKDFPSFQLGGCFYIIKDKFIEWMENETKKLKYHL